MIETLVNLLQGTGLPEEYVDMTARIIGFLAVILIALAANLVAKGLIVRFIRSVIKKTRNEWDDIFVKRGVFMKLSQLAPAIVIYSMAPVVFEGNESLIGFVDKLARLYMVVIGLLFLDSVLNAGLEVYNRFNIARHVPLRSFIQVAKILLYFVGVLFMISLVVNQSPLKLMAGLGAMTAVIMLIFKDPILGFVAGIQLSTNKMLAIGDWIEMPKHGVDGDVIEVALTTVKVQNFDKTITTVPTYAFISDSFKNWRGMSESGGRRIKRSISIDMASIQFCNEEMIQRFSRIKYIREYVQKKLEELQEFNQDKDLDLTNLVNGRRLTNIGTFRAYVEAYLKNHPLISKELTFLVRQLKPTETGLPIEIYVFCTDKRWVHYEGNMADIFDHLLAVIPEFDLRVFQSPSGNDVRMIKG